MAGYSLYLRHHPRLGQQLVPVDVVHRVLEGDLLHAIGLLEQSSYNNSSSFCASDEKHIGFKLQSCPHIERNCNCIELSENWIQQQPIIHRAALSFGHQVQVGGLREYYVHFWIFNPTAMQPSAQCHLGVKKSKWYPFNTFCWCKLLSSSKQLSRALSFV